MRRGVKRREREQKERIKREREQRKNKIERERKRKGRGEGTSELGTLEVWSKGEDQRKEESRTEMRRRRR